MTVLCSFLRWHVFYFLSNDFKLNILLKYLYFFYWYVATEHLWFKIRSNTLSKTKSKSSSSNIWIQKVMKSSKCESFLLAVAFEVKIIKVLDFNVAIVVQLRVLGRLTLFFWPIRLIVAKTGWYCWFFSLLLNCYLDLFRFLLDTPIFIIWFIIFLSVWAF